MVETLTHEAFRKHLGAKFEVELEPEKSIALELIEVSELKQFGPQEGFSIVFLGPNEIFLGQGTRQMKHEEFGEFDIFIVPIAQNEAGYSYQAVFNRVRTGSEAAGQSRLT